MREPVNPHSPADLRISELGTGAEIAYVAMYRERESAGITARYSAAKEAFHDAMSVARAFGLEGEHRRLLNRLDHLRAVFRAQFASLT